MYQLDYTYFLFQLKEFFDVLNNYTENKNKHYKLYYYGHKLNLYVPKKI